MKYTLHVSVKFQKIITPLTIYLLELVYIYLNMSDETQIQTT